MNTYPANSTEQRPLRLPALLALATGLLMVGQWLFFLGAGLVPELQTAPAEIAFHLAAELLTAVALIAAGSGLLRQTHWAPWAALTAFGMLLYAIVNSTGYFVQQGQWPLVLMFALLLALALFSIRQILGAVR